ncbi:restriction endonuclease [Thiocystis violacea]|uniref:restriction endonuclease n=1 Tax=Thiocystis violacea TaxID=13725 RepID=UPI0019033DDE|nr:restriction endonuclease [Thiocystis violacea]MBK1719535.1 hypothetical protein [Thiocystis violacea]
MPRKIAPAAMQALKEALTLVYWYKSELRSFLSQCLSDPQVLSRLNWDDYKRNIVATLIDYLATNEEVYQLDLIRLMSEVCQVSNFSHLRKLEEGEKKAEEAEAAIKALRAQLRGYQDIEQEQKQAEERRKQAHERLMKVNAVQQELESLKKEFFDLVSSENPQQRGFNLEKILKGLFNLFDLDPKASFRITGEQVDGAFSFEGTDYLLEAKWQKDLVAAKDLDGMAGKLSRKLENTLGLFLSINGFSEDAVKAHSSGRRLVILMDGSDLMAVLEGRIDLVQLLLRKRRKAAETGNIYLRIHEIL